MQKAMYLAVGVILALAASVQATPTLMIQSGTNTVTIADNGAGDSNPAVNTVEFIGTVGDWTIDNLTGVESGSTEYPTLNLSAQLSSTEASGITLWFSDTGFGPTPSFTTWNADISGALGGATGSTLDYYKWYDATLFGTNSLLHHLGPFITSPGTDTFSGQASGLWTASGTYSLTEEIVITNVAAETTTFSAEDIIVPEPSTYAMVLLALAGLGVAARRQRHG